MIKKHFSLDAKDFVLRNGFMRFLPKWTLLLLFV
jgi:hypothetical protein